MSTDNLVDHYSIFDEQNHLQPNFDKSVFENLHSWELGWALLEPINIAPHDDEGEINFSKRLSPGQKSLYFFWYLDAQVTNGGFIQFYWNGYRRYLPAIKKGVTLIGDQSMLTLIENADTSFLIYKNQFIEQKEKDDWEPLYDNLKEFNEHDRLYYKIHKETMNNIEKYARQYPNEFINLK